MRTVPRFLLALVALVPWLTQCARMPPVRPHSPALHATDWSAGDAKRLPYERWPAKLPASGKPDAVLLCVHGLSGAASDFWPLGQELPGRDIVVYGMQLRGQGNDPDVRSRGDIRSAVEWQRDVREFHALVSARHRGTPVFWLGESMGSLIALQAITAVREHRPAGLILLSPAVGIREHIPGWKYALVRSLGRLVPGKRVPLATLDPSRVPEMRVTSEATQHSGAETTPHFVPAHSLRLLLEIDRMMHRSGQAAASLDVPLLVLYTPNDPVASRSQIEDWLQKAAPEDKTGLFFPNDYHLILHDADRWSAVDAIGSWVLRRARNGQ